MLVCSLREYNLHFVRSWWWAVVNIHSIILLLLQLLQNGRREQDPAKSHYDYYNWRREQDPVKHYYNYNHDQTTSQGHYQDKESKHPFK